MLIPSHELQELDRLREANLNLQAYEKAKAYGSFSEWEGPDALLLASHLAYSLGAPEESFRLTSRAWHRHKTYPKAIFYFAIELLGRRGPLPALLFMRKFPDFNADDRLMSWWASLYGQLHSTLRDFAVADGWHQRAVDHKPDESWVWVAKAFSLEQQDRYEDALQASRKGFELAPHRRAGISSTAHYLTLLERNDEALELLSSSVAGLENPWLLKHLSDLQTEMGLHAEAYATLQKCFELVPLLEPKTAKWLYGGLSHSAYLVGDLEQARSYAEKADDPFHKKIVENLQNAPANSRRVLLDVPFLRQHHVTCAPATISNIARYWKQKADHLELVEQMCYDGTPSYKERHWADSNGWVTREFTLNWDDATALLDGGVPLTLATIFPGGGHLQAIIGYDERRRTYLIRDPYYQHTGEFLADELLEDQKSSGPRVMALVPAGSEEMLGGRELFESSLYDLLYKVESALESHDRETADIALRQLREQHPDHRITLAAEWSVSSYDTNRLGVRSAMKFLLEQFPEDVNLRLADLSISSEFTGRLERLQTLERYARAKKTDPLMWQMFGYELGLDAKQQRRGLHWLFKSVRAAPGNGLTYRLLGDILWSRRRFEDAAELYRFALSLNDKDEQFAYAYFSAMRHLRREEEALAVLRDRFKRFGKKSGWPACSLYFALRELSRVEEGFAVLDEAVQLRGDDGDLMLYAADAKAHYGRLEDAEGLLERSRERAPNAKWLRTAARVAHLKGDLERSLADWREVLDEDPTATDAHENVAFLIKGLEGIDAAKDYLRRACRRFPTNRSLHVLRLQHLNEEPGEAIAVLRDLTRQDPGDVWSWRELSSWFAQVGRFDRSLEAAEQAVEVDPNDSTNHWFRGKALELVKKYKEAGDAYRTAIALSVDNGYAVASLLTISRTLDAKRQALDIVWNELKSQPSNGDGIAVYRDEARRVIDLVTLLNNLEEYYAANRRSWFAASAVIQQLADMGRTDEAEKLALDATERFPLRDQIWLDTAGVYRLTGNSEREIESLRTAVSVNPVWSAGIQQLADAYQRAGRLTEARDALLDALARLPFDNYLLGYLADIYWNLGERDLAIETAKKAVMFEPEYQWAWVSIKRWAEQTGDRDLPVTLARDLTERKPKDIRAWLLLADMLETGAFSQERLDVVEQAVKIDPFYPPALATKANILADDRRFDEAIEVAQTKMPDGHRPEQLRYVESGIEWMRGNHRRAVDVLVELTETSPGYAPGWMRLADLYRLDPERNREYRKAAMEMVKLAPREARAFGYLAEACLNLELEDEAREALQQAVILEPTYEYGVTTLFAILLKTNDLDEAGRLVESIRTASPLTGLPISVELAVRRGNRADVLAWLREMLMNQDVADDRLDYIVEKAVSYLGTRDKDLLKLLEEVSADGNVNPAAGRYLVNAAWAADKLRGAEAALERISGNRKAWSYAASKFVEILAAEKPRALTKFIDSNAEKLAAETLSWGAVGYQLTNLDDLGRAERWFAGWEKRTDIMPWMLWNYSILLHRGGRVSEAIAVHRASLALRYDDTVNVHLTMLALWEFNQSNFQEAANIFAGVNPSEMTDWERFFYDTLNEAMGAMELVVSGNTADARGLVDSMVDRMIAFDPNNKDRIVTDLAGGALSLLLDAIGSQWYSFRKRAKLLYYSFG